MKKNNKIPSWRAMFGLVMIVIYLAMAYMMIFTHIFDHSFPFGLRIAFAILFAAYGIFRGYRLWKQKD